MKKGIKNKDIRDFEKYANKLNEVVERILEYNQNVEVFLNMDNLELHGGEVFADDEYSEENKVTSVWIANSSGGER